MLYSMFALRHSLIIYPVILGLALFPSVPSEFRALGTLPGSLFPASCCLEIKKAPACCNAASVNTFVLVCSMKYERISAI